MQRLKVEGGRWKILVIIIFFFWTNNIYSLTLQEAVEIALKNNFSIKSKSHTLFSSKYKLKSAKALKMPSFLIDSSFTQLDDSKKIKFTTPFGSESFKITENNYFDVTTGVKLNIYTGGYISENIKASKSDIKEKINDLEEEKLEIAYKTKIAYLNILILKAYEKIAEKHLISLKNHLKDVKNFYKQGLVPYVDILQTKVKVEEANQLLTKIKNQLKVAKTNLLTILGLDPEKKLSVNSVKVNLNKKFEIKKLYSKSEKFRPVLKKLEYKIQKLDHLINMTKSEYKPKIFLFGGYQYSDSSNNIENKGNFLIKANLKFNLDWDKTIQDINSLKEKKMALYFAKEDLKNKIFLQVKKAYEEFLTARKNLVVSKTTVKTAKEYYRIIKLKYKEGLSDNSDVLDAEAMLTKALMQEKTNYFTVISKIFAIERAVGISLMNN